MRCQQVYQEVMQLPPPVLGSRQLFRIATTSIVVQVPPPLSGSILHSPCLQPVLPTSLKDSP